MDRDAYLAGVAELYAGRDPGGGAGDAWHTSPKTRGLPASPCSAKTKG